MRGDQMVLKLQATLITQRGSPLLQIATLLLSGPAQAATFSNGSISPNRMSETVNVLASGAFEAPAPGSTPTVWPSSRSFAV